MNMVLESQHEVSTILFKNKKTDSQLESSIAEEKRLKSFKITQYNNQIDKIGRKK